MCDIFGTREILRYAEFDLKIYEISKILNLFGGRSIEI